MQIYGSSQNIESFTKYGLKILIDARMDYMTALSQTEVYLGEVFRTQTDQDHPCKIFDTEIDKYRQLFGDELVKVRIKSYLGRELGRIIQKIYLPRDSERWQELEHILEYKLDYNTYHSRINGKSFCPAEENAADIFDHAINGSRQITLLQISSDMISSEQTLPEEEGQLKRTRIAFDPHRWRTWFYSLWGQKYEWGSFNVEKSTAIADGLLYFFETPPQVNDKIVFVAVKDMLEAHGFVVNQTEKGKYEYWR
ncbi:MAG: hypothetical protein RBT41_10920 [Clostridia bacterium]|jgi:hypothetical protein|nr:hypothetical protein [Clostridia bacterium]